MNLEMNFIELVDIDDITYNGYENVVDISVEEDESFCLSSGIISHNSAVSQLSAARDPDIHGGLPLRGKLLNVNGLHHSKVVNNMVLRNIMTALGLAVGQKADVDDLRYGKVYFAADADHDGSNIIALLVNFFHTYWPELFENTDDSFFNVFLTPYIIASKGNQRKYWYSDDYHKFDPNDYKGWSITRAKGLGALTEKDWEISLDKPKLVPIHTDHKLAETLDMIFNDKRADDRKDWMGI